MPPRPSKSPAKARSASPKPVKSPATTKPAKSPKATKATPKSAQAASGAPKPEPESEEAEAATEAAAATPAPAPAPAAPAPAGPKSKALPMAAIAVGCLGVLVAVLLLVVGPMMSAKPAAPEQQIGWISSKSFEGKTLKMKGAKNALVIFMTRLEECELCANLKSALSQPLFLEKVEKWKKEEKLKIGKVKCWKNEELCRSFGIAGDEDTATGFPHILHFQDGKFVSSLDERTGIGISAWVDAWTQDGRL